MFNLHHNIYIIDINNNNQECVATATLEELPEIISAICEAKQIFTVVLGGNHSYSAAVTEDLLTYSKKHYNHNNIKVEVI